MGWKAEENSFAGKYTKCGTENWFQISDFGDQAHSCYAVPIAAIFFFFQ